MTRKKLKERDVQDYAYVAVGNYDVERRFKNDGTSIYIVDGICFTSEEWYGFLSEVRQEYLKRLYKD